MNQASRLKKPISSQPGASPAEPGWKPLDRLPGRQERPFYAAITLLVTSLLVLLLYLTLPFFSIQPAEAILAFGLGSLCLFACLHPWLELLLERQFHPEQSLYRQWVEDYGRIIRQTSDLDTLLPYVASTLAATLHPQSVTIWLYQPEDGLLVLAHTEGTLVVENLVELPVDLPLEQLLRTRPVWALPESALRQGLLLLGIETIAVLSLRDELVGLIALGQKLQGRSNSHEMLHLLDWLAAQLALAIKNGHLIDELAETLDQLQLAYRRTIDAQEEERHSLAIELHDDILSRLTTMGMTLSNSQRYLVSDPIRLQSCLELLGQETRYLNGRLREITQGLHPAVLNDLGLIAALQAYMDSLSKLTLPESAPRTIDLTAQGFDSTRIDDPKLERDLYFITRQALDNAIKHAQAEQIFIHLRWRDDAVTITIQDTGVGLKAAPELLMGQQGHLGLLSLQERVLAWRGRLSFQTGSGQGTTVYARLPIVQPSPNPTHLQAFTHYLRSGE